MIIERDKNGNETRYGYDAEDNLLRIRDPLGNEKRFIYRGLDKLSEQRDENGNAIGFEYNSEGQLTTITNENNEKHTFSYDACGRLSSDTGFGGETNTYNYDRKGNLVAIVHPGGALNIRYDKTGRILEIIGYDSQATQCRNTYQYDAAGRLIAARNEHSLVTFEYDALGRIIKEQQGEQTIERIYDAAGNLIARKGPWDTSIAFEYDENDRLINAILPGNKPIRLVRNNAGQPIERRLPGGAYSRCTHDAEGHLLTQDIHDPTDQLLIRRRYRYDANGRLSGVEDNRRDPKQYAYDPAGRLARIRSGYVQEPEDLIHDPAGNLVKKGHQFQARYGNGNRLISSARWAQGCDYTHDAQGNIIARRGENGITDFKYNGLNQLIGCFDLAAGCDLNYFYDALGRRIGKKTFDGREVTYYWDQLQVIAEEEAGNRTEYIYKPETFTPLAILHNKTAYFYHTDHLGTPLELTDENGTLVWKGIYDAFGKCEESIATIPNPLRFPGQQFDRETGLHYNLFRYYDPQTGRYITQDPISYLSQDFNLYRYARGAPVYRTDPFGLGPAAAGGAILVAGEAALAAAGKALAWVAGIVLAAVGAKEAADAISKSESKSKEQEKCDEEKPEKGKKKPKKKTRQSGKEGATDIPSWAEGEKPKPGESGKDFAKRLLDKKYGENNYPTGARSEFSKLQKHGDRHGK